MTTPLDRVASALAPRYLVRRELGAGGMAVVYLAEDARHGRQVAVKVLRPELAAALGPERFLREIRIAAGLRHPHVVPLYDSGEADGLLWYAMPWVEGESLRERLRRERQLPVDDALGIAREAADALAYAHGHGLVHRDVKPENILLEGGHALVADFGIARAVGGADTAQLTATGLAVGTPAYMSPEQSVGDAAVDARSDVYALGCVLYEMLAGEPPFTGATPQAIVARRLSEPAPRIRHVRDAVPAHVEQALVTALARVPADRFRSAAAFRDALAGGGGPAAAAGGRRRTLGIAAAAVAVALAGISIAVPRIARQRGADLPVPAAAMVPGVAVLPFRAVGADPALWHEGIVDLLSYNLDGLGQLRKIDPVAVFTGWRRMGGSDTTALTAEDAREVGRRLGSRYVVTGNAVQIGTDVQLIAEVHDVETGETRGAVRVTRPADSASALVDELTLELLRRDLLPTDGAYPPPSLSRATTTSLPALKAYLAGEREYRTADWEAAVRHYRRAVEADTGFASAWFRLSSACGWGGCARALGEESGKRALELADRLPERDAKRLRAQSTGDVEALEALTASNPDDVEAWVALGESYYHQGGVALRPAEAYRDALRRAIALHPYYGEAYLHLIEDAFLRLDSVDARRLIDGYVALGGTAACSDRVSWDLVWGTPEARRRALAVLDTVHLLECVQAPLAAPLQALDRVAGHYSGLTDTAASAGRRRFALWRLLQVHLPAGRVAAARQALARMAAEPDGGAGTGAARWTVMLHLSGFPDPASARRAARVLAEAGGPTDLFWVGALAVEDGRRDDAAAVRRALARQARRYAAGGAPPGDEIHAYAAAYAAALEAWGALRAGELGRLSAFETALARLPPLLPVGADMLMNEQPQQFLRFRVGKLLYDAGRTRDAERYFRTFQPYEYFYTSPAELYLGRIAEAHGRPEDAAAHYGRFVRWWRYADEPLRPQWEEARRALVRTMKPD